MNEHRQRFERRQLLAPGTPPLHCMDWLRCSAGFIIGKRQETKRTTRSFNQGGRSGMVKLDTERGVTRKVNVAVCSARFHDALASFRPIPSSLTYSLTLPQTRQPHTKAPSEPGQPSSFLLHRSCYEGTNFSRRVQETHESAVPGNVGGCVSLKKACLLQNSLYHSVREPSLLSCSSNTLLSLERHFASLWCQLAKL
jgi:hypothetical protein